MTNTQEWLQALLILWPELPRLVGPAWTGLFPQARELLERLVQTPDRAQRGWLVVQLKELVGPYPQASRRWGEVCEAVRRGQADRGPDRFPVVEGPPPDWPELATDAGQRLEPPRTLRYTDVTAPRRLPRGKLGVITVGLSREPRLKSEGTEPLSLRLDQPVEVHLMALSPSVAVEEKVKTLRVHEGADSEPVVFRIEGRETGTALLHLDFRQDGLSVGNLPLTVQVCEDWEPEEQVAVPAGAVELGGTQYEPPPDLDFRVTVREVGRHIRFHYTLHSPNGALGFHFHDLPGPWIVGSAESYQKELLGRLDQLALGRDRKKFGQRLAPEQVRRRLAGIGEELWDRLFPDVLRSAYQEISASGIRSLQITTDEPWIPWELLKPKTGTPATEPLWCERFDLTRWLSGDNLSQVRAVQVRHLACIAGSGDDLGHSRSQPEPGLGAFAAWTAGDGIEDRSPRPATLEAVEALLDQGGIDLWHFAAHGAIDLDEADAAVIHLADRTVLRPSDLDRQRQEAIGDRRPLVFLNVCSAGQQGWVLTGLGGWVTAWVKNSRAGAFIAPLCTVENRLAHLFATTLYDALRAGETLGRAARTARQAIKAERPEDPTWLAYSVYGHPNARVGWG